eukprot:6644749-Heterocapsa_arctica.AAC.1
MSLCPVATTPVRKSGPTKGPCKGKPFCARSTSFFIFGSPLLSSFTRDPSKSRLLSVRRLSRPAPVLFVSYHSSKSELATRCTKAHSSSASSLTWTRPEAPAK